MSRESYWLYVVLPTIGLGFAAGALDLAYFRGFSAALGDHVQSKLAQSAILTLGGGPVRIGFTVLATWPLFATGLLRLHDVGRGVVFALTTGIAGYVSVFISIHFLDELVFASSPTQWQATTIIIAAVVVVGSLFGALGTLLVLFWPGAKGANRYGPDPLSRGGASAVRD